MKIVHKYAKIINPKLAKILQPLAKYPPLDFQQMSDLRKVCDLRKFVT